MHVRACWIRRTAVLLALVAVLTALALQPGPRAGAAEDDLEPSAWLGAGACAQCHADIYQRWSQASHATTLEEAGWHNVPQAVRGGEEVHHPPGKTRFLVADDGAEVRFAAETQGPDGESARYPLTHVVGKRRVRMYLTTLADGRLQVLPGMYDEPKGEWFDYTFLIFGGPDADPEVAPQVAPGDPSYWTGPVRAFGPRCSACHVSGRSVTPPEPEGDPPRLTWRAMGVDCEQCHGPGARHAAWHAPGAEPKEGIDPLLSYKGLPRDVELPLCLRCHMEGEVVDREMSPGRDLFEHLDPTLLDDPERVDPFGRSLELIYDGLPFLSSACATAGGMTCTSCHDPHGSPETAQLKAARDDPALCAACHAGHVGDAPAHTHHAVEAPGGRCVDCHMPFLVIERGHGIVTDHTISVPRPRAASDRVAQDACTWCHQGERGAPADAPRLDRDALLAAYDRWWPDALPPKPWEQAVARARADPEGGASSLVGLVALLATPDVPRLYRATSARLLGRHAEATRDALLLYAQDADSLVRREAVGALASLEGPEVDEALLVALADPSKPVRRRAARAALAGWARVRLNRELLEAALRELEADAHDVPDDDQRWFRLAAAREIAGDLDGAIDAYARLTVLDRLNRHIPPHLQALRARRDAER